MTSRKEFHKKVRDLLKRQVFFLRECLMLACECERLTKENQDLKEKFHNYRTKLLILQQQFDALNKQLKKSKRLKP